MAASNDWLLSWLTNLNLPEYYSVFNQLGLQSHRLVAESVLDREQLKNIGITKIGHVNRLIRAIEKLRSGEGEADANLTADKELAGMSLHRSLNAPPVPKRMSVRRTSSSPIGFSGSAAKVAFQAPPPVQPRDESLKRMTKSPVTLSLYSAHESLLDVNPFMLTATSISVNGTQGMSNISTAGQVHPTAKVEPVPAPRHPSPSASRRARTQSPAPILCKKQTPLPIPRKRWRRGKSPPPTVGNNVKSVSSLPVGVQLTNGADGFDLQSLSPPSSPYPIPHGSEKTQDYTGQLPTTTKGEDSVSAFGITPPNISAESGNGRKLSFLPKDSSPLLSPSGMRSKKTSLPDRPHPNLVSSHVSYLPPLPEKKYLQKSLRSPSPSRRNTPEDWGVHVTVRSSTPPKPPPRSSTLPVHTVSSNCQNDPWKDGLTSFVSLPDQPAGGSIKYLPGQLGCTSSGPSYGNDKDEENGVITLNPIASAKVHDGSDSLLVPRQQRSVSEESSDFENDIELKLFKSAPLDTSTSICQQSSRDGNKDHEDDIIWDICLPQKVQPDPDYINQHHVENEIACISSGETEKESAKPLGSTKKVIVTQKGACIQDEDDEDEIPKMSIHGKKYDYMNQAEVDRIEIVSPAIRQQQQLGSDYMNQAEVVRIEVVSPAIKQQPQSGSDYINQVDVDRIEVMSPAIRQRPQSGSDYMNQVDVDRIEVVNPAIRQQPQSGSDYVNQVDIDRIELVSPAIRQQPQSGADYMNQVDVDRIELVSPAIRQQPQSGADYVNQVDVDRIELVSPAIRQQPQSGADYMNQVDVDRIELVSPAIRQQPQSGADYVNQVDVDRIELVSPAQPQSGSNQVDVDRIEIASPLIRQQRQSRPDYMNQVDVDKIEVVSPAIRQQPQSGSNQVDVDRIEIASPLIRQQRQSGPDYMNQVDIDKIEVVSPAIRQQPQSGSNQVDVDRIEIASPLIRQQRQSGPDYMNLVDVNKIEVVSPAIRQQPQLGSDYINQDAIDTRDGSSSYMNQAVTDQEGQGPNSEEDFCRSSNTPFKTTLIPIQSELGREKRKGEKDGERINQGTTDASLREGQGRMSEEPYFTEDDFTTDDDDDDDDRIKIRNTYGERLQIRGTLKDEGSGGTNKDYENQDLVDGEIIPMMIAPSGELMTCLKEKRNSENLDTSGGDRVFPRQVRRQTLVETTSSGVNRLSYSCTMDSRIPDRPQLCAEDPSEESALDFACVHPSPIHPSPIHPSPIHPSPIHPSPIHPSPIHPSPIHPSPIHPSPIHPSPIHPSPKLSQSIQRTSPQPMQSPNFNPAQHVLRSFANRSPILSSPRCRMSSDVMSSPIHKASKQDQFSGSPRSNDSDFLSKSSGFDGQDPYHRECSPMKLTRSVGTFAGSECKRPEQLRRVLTEDGEELSRDKLSLTESSVLPGVLRLGSVVAHDVPKTKEGFLYKKGGRRNDRPWQKRWMTFDGSELKYFKNKTDKENLFLNAVELEKMFDVKKVADEVDFQHRFDLVVVSRVFQFYSESAEDCQAWINVLHVAISKFKPQEHEHKEGGSMHCPDKQGYLYKQGHGPFSSKTFRERYVALKGSKFSYYETFDYFKMGRPIHTLEMCLSSVRPDMTSKVPRFLITMNNQKQYLFQSSTDLDRNEWVEKLTMAIMTGIETRPKTLPRGGSTTTSNSQEVLMRVQENLANKMCADCSARDPVWGVINRGIMVCINCSGIHRSFGTHMSKVRSIELDEEVWKNENLIKLMVEIGNDNNNQFWEKHYQGERLPSTAEKEARKNFIQAKYVSRTWIPASSVETRESLSRLLCENMLTNNLLRTIELLALGANSCHLLSEVDNAEKSTPLAIARSSNQTLQAELLELNGASICRKRQSFSVVVSKKGHLYKTGSDRTGWKKRLCTLDQYKGFKYSKSEMGIERGNIHVEELLSVEKCEDEPSHDPRYRHCFEVNTQGRGYLFSAETEVELEEWVDTFQKIISSDAADNLGYDKVGYLKKKDLHSVAGWKKRWFTLRGKNLALYRRERQELDEIDMRNVMTIKGPDSTGSLEQQCTFFLITDDKTYQLRADSQSEAESWVSALRHTQVSGVPLCDQQLTSNKVPIIVHKCLQFVESTGLDVEGLYRISGEKTKIRKLILTFNQDAPGVVLDLEKYSVHDVTGTLKQFLRSLPDPLLTHALYQDFIKTIQSEHEAQMYQLQNLIQRLPAVNRVTLKRVILHLRRVVDNESKNRMSLSNISKLLGPTLMTVDGDPVVLENTTYEYTCILSLIKFYKWLFHVEADEEKREEAIEEAVQKIKEAELLQKRRVELVQQKSPKITSNTDFLTTIYLGMRDGETFNTNITGVTTVQEVVEKVVTCKGLSPDLYALYLVLGDTESHRVLCFSEILLAALCSAGTDHFLCLKRNEFWEALQPHFGALSGNDVVQLYVKEKKKWKKYACSVRDNHFIQFKDSKNHNEVYKIGINCFDIFAGIQQIKMDVKNPMPTRYGFWIKAIKGEEQSRYFCADKKEEILRIMAAVVKAKYSNCLRSPLLPAPPANPPPYSACVDTANSPPRPPPA